MLYEVITGPVEGAPDPRAQVPHRLAEQKQGGRGPQSEQRHRRNTSEKGIRRVGGLHPFPRRGEKSRVDEPAGQQPEKKAEREKGPGAVGPGDEAEKTRKWGGKFRSVSPP